MIRIKLFCLPLLVLVSILIGHSLCAMTMKQLEASMATMRAACMPKYKITAEGIDGFSSGNFPDDKEYKCYTMCIGQMAGTLTKKGEISISKTLAQLEVMVPDHLKEKAKEAINHCKDVQSKHKESCDKTYAFVQCAYNFNPVDFMFP